MKTITKCADVQRNLTLFDFSSDLSFGIKSKTVWKRMGGFEETKKSGRTRSSKNQITSIISAFKFVGGLSMGNFSNL